MKEIWQSAWIALGRRKLRTALTVGSIAIGTAMVVLILCIGHIGKAALSKELENMGVDGLSVSASDGLTGGALSSIRSIPAVRQAMPLSLQFCSAMVSGKHFSVVGCGIDAGADQVISLELLHGRMLSRADVMGQTGVCVVDENFALEAFGRSNAVGQTISLGYESGGVDLQVVGVTATGSSLLQNVTALIPYMIYLPYTVQQTATGVQRFDQIAVRLTEESDPDTTAKTIRRTLSRSGEAKGTLATDDLASQRKRLEGMMGMVSLGLTAIAGVSLLVSGFGILTVMLSSVHERTREIGIKKAIGATRGRIMSEFLCGALLMSFLGALAGLVVGCGGVWLGCRLLQIPPMVPFGSLVGVLFLTVVLGMAFGAYPAYQASGLRPVEALRYEG